jgi:hypothetical protein
MARSNFIFQPSKISPGYIHPDIPAFSFPMSKFVGKKLIEMSQTSTTKRVGLISLGGICFPKGK